MPVVEHSKFHRNHITLTSIDSITSKLNFGSQVKRPLGVGSRRIQDRSDIVSEDNESEESDINVACYLEDVFVLPGTPMLEMFTARARGRRNLPLLLLFCQVIPVAVLAAFIYRPQGVCNFVMIS